MFDKVKGKLGKKGVSQTAIVLLVVLLIAGGILWFYYRDGGEGNSEVEMGYINSNGEKIQIIDGESATFTIDEEFSTITDPDGNEIQGIYGDFYTKAESNVDTVKVTGETKMRGLYPGDYEMKAHVFNTKQIDATVNVGEKTQLKHMEVSSSELTDFFKDYFGTVDSATTTFIGYMEVSGTTDEAADAMTASTELKVSYEAGTLTLTASVESGYLSVYPD